VTGPAPEGPNNGWPAQCRLAGAPQSCVVVAETMDTRYGYFAVGIAEPELLELYRGLIGNLAGFVALHLENRAKAALLRRHRDELERTVLERTLELRSANQQLTTEIEERRRTEEALSRANRELRSVWRAVEQSPVSIIITRRQRPDRIREPDVHRGHRLRAR
jgi:hypothetical protein